MFVVIVDVSNNNQKNEKEFSKDPPKMTVSCLGTNIVLLFFSSKNRTSQTVKLVGISCGSNGDLQNRNNLVEGLPILSRARKEFGCLFPYK